MFSRVESVMLKVCVRVVCMHVACMLLFPYLFSALSSLMVCNGLHACCVVVSIALQFSSLVVISLCSSNLLNVWFHWFVSIALQFSSLV